MNEDEEAINRVLGGEVDAFEPLVRRHGPRVFETVARRVPAFDVAAVAQDVFLSAFRSLNSFEGRRPFEHWLLRIARRRCCDYWREREARRARGEAGLEDDNGGTDWIGRASLEVARGEQARERRQAEAVELTGRALGRLPAEDRALIECLYLEELPVREVAQTLDWSQAKVKVRAHRARKRLRRLLEEGWIAGGES